MSRSGYSDDYGEPWELIRWRGAVASALRGKRGQAFLREMLAALDALPEKKLIAEELEQEGAVCAIGAVGRARGVDMSKIPVCRESIAGAFGVAEAMAAEIMFENDQDFSYWASTTETPEARFVRMRSWIAGQIIEWDHETIR